PQSPRLPDAAHVAPLVTYLLCDLSDSVNGQVSRLDGPSLSITRRPVIGEVSVSETSWTVDSIAAAVDGPLSTELYRVGAETPLSMSAGESPRSPTEAVHLPRFAEASEAETTAYLERLRSMPPRSGSAEAMSVVTDAVVGRTRVPVRIYRPVEPTEPATL